MLRKLLFELNDFSLYLYLEFILQFGLKIFRKSKKIGVKFLRIFKHSNTLVFIDLFAQPMFFL